MLLPNALQNITTRHTHSHMLSSCPPRPKTSSPTSLAQPDHLSVYISPQIPKRRDQNQLSALRAAQLAERLGEDQVLTNEQSRSDSL